MNTDTTVALIGRDAEAGRLLQVLEHDPDAGRVLTVVGEPGVGKSSLLEGAIREAHARGHLVLRSASVETEQALPFVTLQELLAPVTGHLAGLDAVQKEALDTALGLSGIIQPDRHLIARAVLELLHQVSASRPVLLVADDAHWADPSTQQVLATIARRLKGGNVVLMIGARTGYGGDLFSSSLPTMELVGVDDAAAEAILARTADDLTATQKAAIQEQARGNPLALEELPGMVRAGTAVEEWDESPLTVRLEAAFASRVGSLPAEARDVLLIAATDDRVAVQEILAAAGAFRHLHVTAEALASAIDARLITVVAGRVEFRHPLLRSGLLQREPPGRRMAAHAAIAEVVGDVHRARWHQSLAIVGPDDRLADDLEASAEAALRRGGLEVAIMFLERAARLTTGSSLKGRRLLKAAGCSYEIGRVDLVHRQLAAAERTDLDVLGLARLEWLKENLGEGVPSDSRRVTELCTLAENAGRAGDLDLALDLLHSAGLRCWWADTGAASRDLVLATVDRLGVDHADPRYAATIAVTEPVQMCRTVIELLEKRPDTEDVSAEDLRLLGMAAHAVGDEARANRYLREAILRMRREGRLSPLAHVLSMSVVVRQELGDLTGAADAAEEGARLAEETGQPIWNAGTLICEARSRAITGDAAGALQLAGRVEGDARRQRLSDLLACVGVAQGIAWITTGAVEDAFHVLRALFDPTSPTYHRRERYDGIIFLAEAATRAGRTKEIRSVIDELRHLADTVPSPLLHMQLMCARIMLTPDEEVGPLFAAVADTDLTDWPWVRARIQLLHGRWLHRQGRTVQARTTLLAAADELSRIGAVPWAEVAEREIRELSDTTATGTGRGQ